MKNPSPREVVLITSGGASVILLVLLLINWLAFPTSLHWSLILAVPVVMFTVSFILFSFSVEKFIYRKIKLIYKTIYTLKAPKGASKSAASKEMMRTDVIGDVEREVLDWTTRQSKEIETLKQLADYRKEFVGNVSHELKTPIFNIQGYLHTLIDGGIEDSKINLNYLMKASENLERLSNIVGDLEVISQIESNTLLLEMNRFDIIKLVKDVFADLEVKAETRNIILKLKQGLDEQEFVKADRERIRQALINLIANSIRYGREGGRTTIGVYDMHENILIEVSDNGIGISEENLSRIFERFFRVDKSRSRELGGTGLGLSIVKHIIEAHGQIINVRSTVGVGSTFGFTLRKG